MNGGIILEFRVVVASLNPPMAVSECNRALQLLRDRLAKDGMTTLFETVQAEHVTPERIKELHDRTQ